MSIIKSTDSDEKAINPAAIETRFSELVEKGRMNGGSISVKDVMDALEDLRMTPEQIDRVYERLEHLGIETSDDEFAAISLDEDLLPDPIELEELEEPEEIVSEDSDKTGSPVMPNSRQDEIAELASRIEFGNITQEDADETETELDTELEIVSPFASLLS
ncbi:MAG: hypothetical protein LBC38_04290, partial [Oscillospiraceae bacterium]|nr:hypothetical protein [Oscillospiraceae bacterium]